MQSSLHISKSTVYLCVSLFVLQAVYTFAVTRNHGSSTDLDSWYPIALFWAMGWWFVSDNRTSGIRWNDRFLDMGLLLYVAWIFLLPYYLFRSRGWKAIYTVLLLLGVYVGASITGLVLQLISALFL